jgi:hypothetical protein
MFIMYILDEGHNIIIVIIVIIMVHKKLHLCQFKTMLGLEGAGFTYNRGVDHQCLNLFSLVLINSGYFLDPQRTIFFKIRACSSCTCF